MTGDFAVLVEDYLALRRGLGYRLEGQSRYLRNFAGFLDRTGHHGPVPLQLSVDWATSTSSPDPCNRARRLSVLRDFLRHRAALDGATEVPPPGVLGPTYRRKPPHVYSDGEITSLLRAAAALTPAGGLRPHCYVTLFSLLACTGLRISEALALSRADVDLADGVLTVRAGKGGRTRLAPLHPSALEPARLRRPARPLRRRGLGRLLSHRSQRPPQLRGGQQHLPPAASAARLERPGPHQGAAHHDLRHRMVVRRLQLWHAQGADVDRKIAALATYLGHVGVSDVYWYLSAVPELMTVVADRFEAFARRREAGAS